MSKRKPESEPEPKAEPEPEPFHYVARSDIFLGAGEGSYVKGSVIPAELAEELLAEHPKSCRRVDGAAKVSVPVSVTGDPIE